MFHARCSITNICLLSKTENNWDQSQVTTVWNTGETGDIYAIVLWLVNNN